MNTTSPINRIIFRYKSTKEAEDLDEIIATPGSFQVLAHYFTKSLYLVSQEELEEDPNFLKILNFRDSGGPRCLYKGDYKQSWYFVKDKKVLKNFFDCSSLSKITDYVIFDDSMRDRNTVLHVDMRENKFSLTIARISNIKIIPGEEEWLWDREMTFEPVHSPDNIFKENTENYRYDWCVVV